MNFYEEKFFCLNYDLIFIIFNFISYNLIIKKKEGKIKMTLASAILRAWDECAAVFNATGYSFFKIEAHVVCTLVLIILFNYQLNSSDQTESRIAWFRLVFVQILYCISGIIRVFIDIEIIPKSPMSQYLGTAINFGLFVCICWLVFVYVELYQKSTLMNSLKNKILVVSPLIFTVIMLGIIPFTGLYSKITDEIMTSGTFFIFMFLMNLIYPLISLIFSIYRRKKMTKYERDTIPGIAIYYPAIFLICGPLQAFNWRVPFLCYAILVADIFVYINYADSLVSVDPLTKIPNKNGMIRYLSERLRELNNEENENEDKNLLYVFAVDIDGLGTINSHYGRSEGDKVLILTARALKKFRDEAHTCYASRYYGDEFMIIAEIQDKDELEIFVEHIKNYINNAAVSEGLPYHLRVNIGWSVYKKFSKTESISGLIEEAEKMLDEKREQKRVFN